MCWPRSVPSIDCYVSGKRCALRLTVSPLLLPTGCVPTASRSGWIARVRAVKSRACLWGKPSDKLLPKTSDGMELACLLPSLIQQRLSGCVMCLPQIPYNKKRSTTWVGYKGHLRDRCEPDVPLLITHVETTSAPVSDDAMTASIHAELERKELWPSQHLVDTGYVDAKLLEESQRDYHVDLVGPTRADYRGPARQKKGFDASHFLIDWQQQQATCPEGHTSISWTPAIDNRKNEVIKIKFSTTDCQLCPSRS